MDIKFEKLRFKNVLSYGNTFTEFNFEQGIDLTKGGNGSGKSAIIDSLTFALYGKPFRKINLGALVNYINGGDLATELYFSIRKIKYKIIRGIAPNIFEIYKFEGSDYVLIPPLTPIKRYQDYLIDNILMLPMSVFKQLVILGSNISSSKQFMDLSQSEKEDIFQILTDTKVFNKIKDKINQKTKELRNNIVDSEYKRDIIFSSLNNEKSNIEKIKQNNELFSKQKVQSLENYKSKILELDSKIDKSNKILEKLTKIKDDAKNVILTLKKKEGLLHKLTREYDSNKHKFEEHTKNTIVCPNCGTEIVKDKLNITKDLLSNQLSNITELETEVKELRVKLESYNEKIVYIKRIISDVKDYEQSKIEYQNEIIKIENFKEIEVDISHLESLEQQYLEIKEAAINHNQELQDFKQLENIIFANGLKAYIISKQLPILNKYINQYIERFTEFNFNFVIDGNFNSKIISRQDQKDFNSLSNGQKMRISFSIMFAFLKFIEEKNNINLNLLMLDEVLDSSLDFDGRNELMSILFEFKEFKNIIIISHNPKVEEKRDEFNRIIEVEKNKFSKLNIIDNGV
jgi:DNA repair exonuclease SbcCD ATPase subunit